MNIEDRRQFISLSLAAAAASGLPGEAAAQNERTDDTATRPNAALPTYLVIYRRGPNWADGKPMREQRAMLEHFKLYVELHRAGRLREAGGFADESGGAALFEAADDAAAVAFVSADPAVVSGTFAYELKRWQLNPWEQFSRKRTGAQ